MATYVNDLRLKEIATGDESGTWGASTNTNLELIAEAFSFGTEAITTNADTHTTTIAAGSSAPGRSIYLKYTGTLDSACTITIGPNTVSKLWFIENGTSGSQNIIISQGSGANVTIPAGHVKAVYSDGAGSGAAIVDAFTDLNLAGTTTVDVLSGSGNATIGGTLGVTGIVTLTDDLIIGDGKTIGSASDVDAMTIASNGQVTFSQTLIGTALDISGDIDVDGTTNLDAVDIDGAVDMASTLAVGGVVTANAGVVVDNITIDGTEIDLSSGDLTIDVAGDIILDAGGDDITFKSGGTEFGGIFKNSNDMFINSAISDGDIKFRGNDGGSFIIPLILDMSEGGTATFLAGATFGNNVGVTGTLDASSQVLVGTNDSIFSENNIRFKPSGGAFIDHNTTGQNINFRVSNSSSLDTTPLIISSSGITVAGNIANSSGDMTIDIAGDIILDADGGDFTFKDGGTTQFQLQNSSGDVQFVNNTQDKDIKFMGDDGGSTITAITLDMSEAGAATFNAGATFGGDIALSTSSYPKITLNDETGVDRQYSIGTSNETFIIRNETGSTDSFVIDNSNNVGIGTTSPSFELDVRDDGTSGVAVIGVRGGSGGAGSVQISGNGTTYGSTSFDLIQNSAGAFLQHRANLPLIFATNDTERMRIDASGNLGIGTTPDRELHLKGAIPRFRIEDSDGGYAEISGSGGHLTLSADGGDSQSASRMAFEVDGTERARILSDGHFLLGTTSNQGVGGISFEHGANGFTVHNNTDATSGGYEFYVFRRNSTQIGSIAQSSTNAVQYNTSSDARLKDVTGSSRGLDVINNLNPVAYNWKADNHADEGLIAQEVEKLVPNAVNQNEDGYYQMDYSKLVTHLVKGMQEQQEQIELLKSEIANLKEK